MDLNQDVGVIIRSVWEKTRGSIGNALPTLNKRQKLGLISALSLLVILLLLLIQQTIMLSSMQSELKSQIEEMASSQEKLDFQAEMLSTEKSKVTKYLRDSPSSVNKEFYESALANAKKFDVGISFIGNPEFAQLGENFQEKANVDDLPFLSLDGKKVIRRSIPFEVFSNYLSWVRYVNSLKSMGFVFEIERIDMEQMDLEEDLEISGSFVLVGFE